MVPLKKQKERLSRIHFENTFDAKVASLTHLRHSSLVTSLTSLILLFSISRASIMSLVKTPDRGFFFLGGFLPEIRGELSF